MKRLLLEADVGFSGGSGCLFSGAVDEGSFWADAACLWASEVFQLMEVDVLGFGDGLLWEDDGL